MTQAQMMTLAQAEGIVRGLASTLTNDDEAQRYLRLATELRNIRGDTPHLPPKMRMPPR